MQKNHTVEVLEAAPEIGGMAAHFNFDGLSIERFYHFVCKSDQHTFDLMAELGIGDKMRWRQTSMGYFMNGRIHPWGDPISLLRSSELSLLPKIRYGLFVFVSTRRERWDALENETARSWITRWCGSEVYDRLWKPLFDYKFYRYADDISAAWIWTRIKRIGRSRKSLFSEELGYAPFSPGCAVDPGNGVFMAVGAFLRQSPKGLQVFVRNRLDLRISASCLHQLKLDPFDDACQPETGDGR